MAESSKGQTVNRTQLAAILGVSLPTVDDWVRKGCPIVSRGGKGVSSRFNTADVIRWLRDRAVAEVAGEDQQDENELDLKMKRAKLEAVELDLAKAKGEVAPVAEFERVQAARSAVIRQNVMNVPQRAVLQLLGCTDETIFKETLRKELTLALETAATAALELPEEEEADA